MLNFNSLLASAADKASLTLNVNAEDERSRKDKTYDFMEKLIEALAKKGQAWVEHRFVLSRHQLKISREKEVVLLCNKLGEVKYWWKFYASWCEPDEIFNLKLDIHLTRLTEGSWRFNWLEEYIPSSKVIPDLDPRNPSEDKVEEIADRIHARLLAKGAHWIGMVST